MSSQSNGVQWEVAGKGSRACKFGAYGLQGSGKTTTMAILARALAQRLEKKTVYMVDSEGGADFINDLFQSAKISLQVIRSREFGTLVKVFESMQQSDEIVLVDSVTHFWNDVVRAYSEATQRKTLRVQDWKPIFETWRLFTGLYTTSACHALVCGRMGYEYANAVDESGNLEFYRSDTKMKAGEQFGHEPDLLLYMQQIDNAALHEEFRLAATKDKRQLLARKLQQEAQINIVATVEKDRSRLLMARRFIFSPEPKIDQIVASVEEAFAPVIDWHLKQKTTAGLTETGATRAMLTPQGNEFEWQERKRRTDFALDEIKETLTKHFPGMSAKEKQAKIEVSERIFGVKSWEGICQKDLEILEAAIKTTDSTPSLLERACIEKAEVLSAKEA